MLGLGIPELLIILVIIIILFGARRLPEVASGLGKAIRSFKKATTESEEIDVTPKNKPEDRKDDTK